MDEAAARRAGVVDPDGRRAGAGRPGDGSAGGQEGRSSAGLGEAERVPGRTHRVHPPRTSPEALPEGPHAGPARRDREGEGTGRPLASSGIGGGTGEPSAVHGRPARPLHRPPRVRVHRQIGATPGRAGPGAAARVAARVPVRPVGRAGQWGGRREAEQTPHGDGRTVVGRGEAACAGGGAWAGGDARRFTTRLRERELRSGIGLALRLPRQPPRRVSRKQFRCPAPPRHPIRRGARTAPAPAPSPAPRRRQ